MSLWRCMTKHQNKDYPVDDALRPEKFLPAVVKRSDVLEWGRSLKETLQLWMEDAKSPFSAVRSELGSGLFNADGESSLGKSTKDQSDFEISFPVSHESKDLVTTALPLITDLHARGALPGILFNYDRDACEATVVFVQGQLAQAEKAWKEANPEWTKMLADYEVWKKAKSQAQGSKADPKKRPVKTRGQDGEDVSKLDMMRDASVEVSKWDSFDPDAPLERFSFADGKKITASELEPLVERLVRANVQPEIIAALRRGIAVHHAGMNRNYRQM